jgi:DNA-directed RNA polymerase specialized sigma24 family protein
MSRLQLHDIDDAVRFCAAIVAKSNLRLSYHDNEDLRQYLVTELWRLSERYEPGGISFSTLARTTLRKRLVDWRRKQYGRRRWQFTDRVYERPSVELVSLDDPGLDRLGAAVGRSGLDDGEPGLADGLRSLQARARRPRGRNRRLGDEAA